MKTKDFVTIVFLAGLGLIVIGLEYADAEKEKKIVPPRIGIVSVKDVFDKCQMKAEVEKIAGCRR